MGFEASDDRLSVARCFGRACQSVPGDLCELGPFGCWLWIGAGDPAPATASSFTGPVTPAVDVTQTVGAGWTLTQHAGDADTGMWHVHHDGRPAGTRAPRLRPDQQHLRMGGPHHRLPAGTPDRITGRPPSRPAVADPRQRHRRPRRSHPLAVTKEVPTKPAVVAELRAELPLLRSVTPSASRPPPCTNVPSAPPCRPAPSGGRISIHIMVAVQWQQSSSGDWTAYAADLSRRNANQEP
jgi:hypothetical protein